MKQVLLPPLIFLLVLFLGSCPTPEIGGGNSLFIGLPDTFGQDIIVENVDANVSSFVLTGMGPDGASFRMETTGTNAAIGNLAAGPWVVTAEARNADGVTIGCGNESATVENSHGKKVTVTLCRVREYGTLELTVLWDAPDVRNPVLKAVLLPLWGRPRFLPLAVTEPGTAFWRETHLPEGWYLLTVVLKDNRRYVAGAIILLKINGDEVTQKIIDFRKTVPDNGTIQVNITPEMADPLTVGMRGQLPEIAEGQDMTVTSYLTAPAGNVVFAWYLNGEGIGVGDSVSVGSMLPPGVYRLDVTAFTADGLRGGSTGWDFHVVSN